MIKSNSKNITKSDTFIAIKNLNRDGHDYINDAINKGASKIIVNEDYDTSNINIEILKVKDTYEYYKNYIYNEYYEKIKDLKLVGITGTNGKTTTAYLTYQILNKLGKKAAYIGTIGFYCNNEKTTLNNTTPDINELYDLLLKAKDNECEYVIMEVSSIALDRDRIYGLQFDVVAFTNLTIDHLDYHKTIENYIDAKKILFNKTRNKKISIINSDDKYHKEFILDKNNNITYGKNGNAKISNLILTNQYSKYTLDYLNNKYNIKIDLIGKFNVYNFTLSLLIVNNLGINIKDILKVSNMLTPPLGRMQLIKYKTNSIFIDYAHTPDAVENVIDACNEYRKGKIITIIGCGGDRDATKRPIMGMIATNKSDYVIFTNDNPRTENENNIINDILKGVTKRNYEVITNRKEATKKAISLLTENDILLILGKGHEDYQIIGKEKQYYSDSETVMNILKK